VVRDRLLHDIRFAARLLGRDRSFTVVALATLSLGIAAAITVFAVLKAILLTPLPFPDADRLVLVWERTPAGDARNMASAYNVLTWQSRNMSFAHLGAVMPLPMNVTGVGEADQVDGLGVVGGFFDALGAHAQLGRTLTERDTADAIVIADSFWQQRMGRSPDVIGRSITVNGRSREIVGVMPPGFAFPAARSAQLYAPMPIDPSAPPGGRNLTTVGRLKPGVTLETARADMRRVVAQLIAEQSPGVRPGWSTSVFSLFDETVAPVQRTLWVIGAAVTCLLVLACANVANLLLVRAARRAPELAVRVALGAGRLRLVQQLAAEASILAAAAGAIALGIAWVVALAIPSMFPATFPLPRASEIAIDRSIVVFTLALCGLIATAFSLLPVVRLAHDGLNHALRTGRRTATVHSRLRRGMVVAEVAIALVLVCAAVVTGKSLAALYEVDPGFKSDRVLTLRMLMLPSKYFDPSAQVRFLGAVLERVRATPGVVSAASIHFLPLSGIASSAPVFRLDRPQPSGDQLRGSPVSVITEGYFTTMGIPLSGRDFDDNDSISTPRVAIVNRALARQLFPNENPIGHRIAAMYSPGTRSMEIVGVAGDVRTSSLDRDPGPAIYIAHTQEPSLLASLVVRTQGPPAAAVASVRSAIAAVDPEQGVAQMLPLDTVLANTTARPRVQAGIFGMFGALALIIATVGLYGVIAYGVEQRRREIGVRLALGAAPRVLLQRVVAEGLVLAVAGSAIGAGMAWLSSGALDGMLYGTTATDPQTFAMAASTLVLVACLATLVPAVRASRVDPLAALRDE
jgi:putative ABC transport system permease protein